MAGAGTAGDPWLIESTADLQNIGKADANSANWADGKDESGNATTKYNAWTMAGYYKLAADLDWENHHTADFKPIGHGATTAFTAFTGQIDGDGHKISNLVINQSSDTAVGFIANLHGVVKALTLESIAVVATKRAGALSGYMTAGSCFDCHASGSVTTTGDEAGGLLGEVIGTGISIEQCSCSCSVTMNGGTNTRPAGGLIAYLRGGSAGAPNLVKKCFATGNISTTGDRAGGFVGHVVDRATIEDCYSSGNASAGDIICGGFVGVLGSGVINILNCYSCGDVSATANVYGFVGDRSVSDTGTKSDLFYDSTVTGDTANYHATGKTTAQMKTLATFTNWDIVAKADYVDEDWFIDEDNDYPRLGWEYVVAETPTELPGCVNVGGILRKILSVKINDNGVAKNGIFKGIKS